MRIHAAEETVIDKRPEHYIEALTQIKPPGGYLSLRRQRFVAEYETRGYHPFGSGKDTGLLANLTVGCDPALRRKVIKWALNTEPLNWRTNDADRENIIGNFASHLHTMHDSERMRFVRNALVEQNCYTRYNAMKGLLANAQELHRLDQLAIVETIFAKDHGFELGRSSPLIASQFSKLHGDVQDIFFERLQTADIPPGFFDDVVKSLFSFAKHASIERQITIVDAALLLESRIGEGRFHSYGGLPQDWLKLAVEARHHMYARVGELSDGRIQRFVVENLIPNATTLPLADGFRAAELCSRVGNKNAAARFRRRSTLYEGLSFDERTAPTAYLERDATEPANVHPAARIVWTDDDLLARLDIPANHEGRPLRDWLDDHVQQFAGPRLRCVNALLQRI